MSVTLDITTAGASANAYADATFYDAYFESNVIFTSVWGAFTSGQKAARIVEATKAMDLVSVDFSGVPYSETQALEFPRDISSSRFPSSSIHRRVKEAAGEMLVYQHYSKDATNGSIDGKAVSKIAAVNGLVDIEYFEKNETSASDQAAGGSLARVRALLAPWLGAKTLKRY